ncbi:ADP-glyceromanno-heptose 6-epimerase [Rhizobium sp. BK251]|uniref:ADP-glyceromanno-heptose 6-epimerase n=1 Tax=Rhizobium sp. BK251 TaxID=2512125 RepID=UPI0010CF3976|nr:ADP-glyceromanno-heptose 6-epimerase [Rhizobium sp. BK251]TCL66373.1 ADP-glyceromanno-heptose 6-epimerase precursor [Rhizobium sp. BK251]
MLSDKLVLITGAAGFIGSNIARSLAEDGAAVVACDWFGSDDRWRNLAGVGLENIIRPQDLMSWLATSRRVEVIIHMGAISATTERDVDRIVSNNIRLTLDLWDYCCRTETAFIYASSAATYGDGSQGFSNDDSEAGLARLQPLTAYGWSKHVVDRRIAADVARARTVPRRWAGLKFFNVYGPRESHKLEMRSVVHKIWPSAAAGKPIRLFRSDNPRYPNGGQMRDFVHVDDCVHVVRRVLDSESIGGIFNVGTGQARSFRDLALAVFDAVGQPPRIEYVDMPEALRSRYQYFTQADITRLVSSSLAPNFKSLEDGVASYVDWLSRHPDR